MDHPRFNCITPSASYLLVQIFQSIIPIPAGQTVGNDYNHGAALASGRLGAIVRYASGTEVVNYDHNNCTLKFYHSSDGINWGEAADLLMQNDGNEVALEIDTADNYARIEITNNDPDNDVMMWGYFEEEN